MKIFRSVTVSINVCDLLCPTRSSLLGCLLLQHVIKLTWVQLWPIFLCFTKQKWSICGDDQNKSLGGCLNRLYETDLSGLPDLVITIPEGGDEHNTSTNTLLGVMKGKCLEGGSPLKNDTPLFQLLFPFCTIRVHPNHIHYASVTTRTQAKDWTLQPHSTGLNWHVENDELK